METTKITRNIPRSENDSLSPSWRNESSWAFASDDSKPPRPNYFGKMRDEHTRDCNPPARLF